MGERHVRGFAPVVEGAAEACDGGVRGHSENSAPKLPFESVHDGQHRDEGGDPKGNAQNGDEADEGDESDALLRPQVTEPDREFQRPDHGRSAASGRRTTWRRR